jgi:tetratricopeptide (TPR) repeat protein
MKIFRQGILARRKIVFIFLLAILLPSLVVGYLSFSTFAERRESVRRLLESNLWISGESALKSIEDALLEHEKEALNPENFTRLNELKETDQILSNSSKLSKEIAGQLFLLDAEYQIIIPKTGKEDISIFPGEKSIQNTEFALALKQAESLEFSGKNYSRAAESYRKCYSLAPTNQHKALAQEALGRCLLSSKKYGEAYRVYIDLSAKYGQFLNKAGHPYGILAAFQQYEIERRRKREENSLKILLSLYGKMS